MTDKEKAYAWIKNHIDSKEFEDCLNDYEEETVEGVMDWFAYEMDKFHKDLAPKTPINAWIKRNYTVNNFFDNHEKQANRYYGI